MAESEADGAAACPLCRRCHEEDEVCGTLEDPRDGQIIGGRYQILRRLAAGGMGTVYEARHLVLERHFAIKILHATYAGRPRVVRRFLREANLVGALANAHIVGVIESGDLSGLPYFVMELLHGKDLRHLLSESRRLPVSRAANILLDVCRGLGVAHAAGLVHRDLKPANIFITSGEGAREIAKVLDFGVAKLRNAADSTAEGTLIGTVGYMAPEQIISGRNVDQRSDIYSLGLILYEMLAGQPVHRGEKAQVLFRIAYDDAPALEMQCPEVPKEIARVVTRALARDPAQRYQSVGELASVLESFVGWPSRHDVDGGTPRPAASRGDSDTPTSVDLDGDSLMGEATPILNLQAPTPRPRWRRRASAVGVAVVVLGILWGARVRHRLSLESSRSVSAADHASPAPRASEHDRTASAAVARAGSVMEPLLPEPAKDSTAPEPSHDKQLGGARPRTDVDRVIDMPATNFDAANPYVTHGKGTALRRNATSHTQKSPP